MSGRAQKSGEQPGPPGGGALVPRDLKQVLAPYKRPDARKALFQLVTTGGLYAAAWAAMLASLSVSYWLTLLLALPAAGLLVRLFIFQHDCGHGSFFPSRAANNLVGSILGVLILTPYGYWRRTHAIHHATSGDLDRRTFGDVDTLTVREYLALSRWGRLRYRLYRNPLILFFVGPFYQFVLKHRLPLDTPRGWKREWKSVMWTNAALVGLVALAWSTLGLVRFLQVQLPITLISGTFGVWLFYIQHQFEDTYWQEHERWDFQDASLEGSSFYDLPAILRWFSGNIGYHHIHHLSSLVPNYRLRACYEENPEFHRVTRLTLWESLKCLRLRLWDETESRLVGFSHLRSLKPES